MTSVQMRSDPLSTVRGDKLPGEVNGPDPYRTLPVGEFLHVQYDVAFKGRPEPIISRQNLHAITREGSEVSD